MTLDSFAQQRQRLLALMRELAFEKRSVTLSSGHTSDFYVDSKQAILTAEGHFLVGQLFYALMQKHAAHAEAVGGMTMGADPMASAVSLVSFIAGNPKAAFYVRKEAKGHGTQRWIEGLKSLRAGMPVVIVEDVVTTGASTIKAIDRAAHHDLNVVCVLALVDRQEEDGRANVEQRVPLHSLFSRQDFLT